MKWFSKWFRRSKSSKGRPCPKCGSALVYRSCSEWAGWYCTKKNCPYELGVIKRVA